MDLRTYREGANARDARFIEAGADFAAAIHGLPKDDLLSQEVRQQKKTLRLVSSAVVLLLFLAGLAGWQAKVAIDNERVAIDQRNIAEQQRQLAQEQRDRAERTLAAATETANTLVVDLAREFRDRAGMPRDLVRRILDRAHALQRQLAESGETAPELRHSEAIALGDLMDVFLALGDTKAALEAGQRSRMIMEQLVTADPGNTEWQRDLSFGHTRVGDALAATGRRAEALAEYRQGLIILEKLAAADPDRMQRQRDLSISYMRIGDVLIAAGQREEALAEYRKSLAIREKLVTVSPGNTLWHRELAVNYTKVGDVLLAAGRLDDALAEYRRSLAIRQKLAASDPGNTQWQRDLSTQPRQHRRRAEHGEKLWGEALAEFRASFAIAAKLAAADPGNTGWQRDLSISHNRIGDLLLQSDRRQEALAEYHSGLAIVEKLTAADSNNTEWQADLVTTLYRISIVSETAQARTALHRAIATIDALAKIGALTAAQKNWPQLFRELLAKLPPETAGAQ